MVYSLHLLHLNIKSIMLLKCILLLFLSILSSSSQNFTLFTHADSQAKCLDGSPSGLYFHPGQLSDKFIIYFQGGGLCRGDGLAATIQYCYQRSFTHLGSSKNYASSRSFQHLSLLSSDSRENPFFNWNRIFVPYCDGGLHQGSAKAGLSYKDRLLWFRGANNTLAHFQFLENNFNLWSASQIVISGTSAGGMAAYIWSNYVYQHAVNPNGVLIIPDSGIFMTDFPNIYNNKTMNDYTQTTFSLINRQTPMPLTSCLEQYPTQRQCFQAGNLAKFIKPPLFILQSQYDEWGLQQILQFRCVPTGFPSTLQKCNDTQKAYIEKYRILLNQAVRNLTEQGKNGVWSVSCVQHGFVEDGMDFIRNKKYRIPTTKGVDIYDALLQFMEGGRKIYVDEVGWPDNTGCSGRVPGRQWHLSKDW